MNYEKKDKMNSYRHFYLYAKHWYKRTDVIEDLKVLIKERSGIPIEYIRKRDIIDNLIDLAWLSITRSGNPAISFREFVVNIAFPNDWWKFNCNKDVPIEVITINKCLSIMSITEVSKIDGELGEPDYNILPKPTKGI